MTEVIQTGKVCDICGWVGRHQGALNIHKYHCKMKHGRNEKVEESLQDCTHDWRLLTASSPLERKAVENGYTEVCRKCQEVRT